MSRCWLGDRLADESAQHDAECETCRGTEQERPARLTPGMMAEYGRLDVMWQSLVADLDAAKQEVEALKAINAGLYQSAQTYKKEAEGLKDVIDRIDKAISVPAAEYVPAIRDVFLIIDRGKKQQ
jgi:hypothetical protein